MGKKHRHTLYAPLFILRIQPYYSIISVKKGELRFRLSIDELKSTDGLFVAMFISDFTILQVASEIYQKSSIKVKVHRINNLRFILGQIRCFLAPLGVDS